DEFLPLARDYFDIFTFHAYCGTALVGPRGNTIITDSGLKKKLNMIVDYFNAQGWKKEMWAGEQGWRLDYSVPPDSIYAKEHARTVTKSLVQTRSFPQVKRFVWHNHAGGPDSKGYLHGLWRNPCYPLPAVNAYATTAWMLKDVEDGKELNLHSEDIEGYIFPRKKETVAVIWVNRGKEEAQLAFTCKPEDIEVIDYMGNPVSVNRSGDRFKFNFGRDPVFIKSERIPFSSLANMIEEEISFAKPLKVEIIGLKLPCIQVLLTSQDKQELFGKAKIKITPHQELAIFEREFHLSPYGTQTLKFELSEVRIGELKHSTMDVTITTPQIEFTSTTHLNFLCCCKGKPDKIDGSLSDWPGREPIYLKRRNQVLPSGAGVWNGEDDLSAVAYLMYDDEYLYFGAALKDDVHINDEPASALYGADGIQIGTGDSECYQEIGIALTSSGIKNNKDQGSNPGKPVKGIKIAIKEKDNKRGLIYEAAIPLDAFQPMRILPGKMIPFAFIINDEDGKGRKWMGIDNPAVIGATKDVKA
ncbi:MAG: hypothetical protein KAX20_02405, partial [Candidatus Omnitrophica bacterium]|nr:hypothetical protein [Candidatus Omnitrophota bacterium]